MADLMAIKDLVAEDWEQRSEEARQRVIEQIHERGRELMDSAWDAVRAELTSVDRNPRNALCGGEILAFATHWLLREGEA